MVKNPLKSYYTLVLRYYPNTPIENYIGLFT